MRFFLAAIRTAPANPGATPGPGTSPAATPDLIRDIAPPVDYFPYPLWMVIVASLVLLALVAVLGYWIYRASQRKPAPVPPRPRVVALRELQELEAQVKTLAPYEFSIAVSAVLRRFVEGQYHVRAMEETTPEFLADIAERPNFAPTEKSLLADFLGRCDMVKFGRVEADETVNGSLISSAKAFVQGGVL